MYKHDVTHSFGVCTHVDEIHWGHYWVIVSTLGSWVDSLFTLRRPVWGQKTSTTTVHQLYSRALFKWYPNHVILLSFSSSSSEGKVAGGDQPKLFDRIDASKLQGALSNASMMGHLEVRLHPCCGHWVHVHWTPLWERLGSHLLNEDTIWIVDTRLKIASGYISRLSIATTINGVQMHELRTNTDKNSI